MPREGESPEDSLIATKAAEEERAKWERERTRLLDELALLNSTTEEKLRIRAEESEYETKSREAYVKGLEAAARTLNKEKKALEKDSRESAKKSGERERSLRAEVERLRGSCSKLLECSQERERVL